MAEPSKTMRQVLLASVQGLRVTRADLTGADAIVLDAGVVATAGLLPNEKVEVLNGSTGARFSTSLSVSQKAPGAVEICGPAAHFAGVGDQLAVAAFAWLKEKAAARHAPRVVKVDERNRVVPAPTGSSEHPVAGPGTSRKARRA